MTKEEKKIVLRECAEKIIEIESKREQVEKNWNNYYNKNYRFIFKSEDVLDKVSRSLVTGLVVFVSVVALQDAGHPPVLTLGGPLGGYSTVVFGSFLSTLVASKKRKKYEEELIEHANELDRIESEKNPYQMVSEYLTTGDSYLWYLYRENLEEKVGNYGKDDLSYLEISSSNLTPLMVKTIEEMKTKTVTFQTELKSSLITNISTMYEEIRESDISVCGLEAIQKVLKQYVPEEASLTS